jgi:hypothetical protein
MSCGKICVARFNHTRTQSRRQSRQQSHNSVGCVTRVSLVGSGKPKATVSFTPGKSRTGNRLLSIKLTGGSAGRGPLGFDYAELAGVRRRAPKPFSKVYQREGLNQQHRVNGQGDAMIEEVASELNPIRGKAGYFAFNEALQKVPVIEQDWCVGVAKVLGENHARTNR